ncbi:MAG: hypothetical protein WCP58_07150 [bacterium]
MSYLLALDAPDVFKAAAPVSGNINDHVWQEKNPPTAIPIFHIHGTNDKIVPMSGDGKDNAPPTQEIIDYWVTANGCTTVEKVALTDHTTAYYYRNGENGS